jgi:hypothetical protein
LEDGSGVELFKAAMDLRGAKDRQIQQELLKEKIIFRLAFKYPKSTMHYIQLDAAVFSTWMSIMIAAFSLIGVYAIGSELIGYTPNVLIYALLFTFIFVISFVVVYHQAFHTSVRMMKKENEWEIIHITDNYLIISRTNNKDLGIQHIYDKYIERTRYALAIEVKNIIKIEPRFLNSILRKWLERPDIQFLKMRRWGDVLDSRFTNYLTVPSPSVSRVLMELKKLNPGIIIDARIETGLNF